ncbi:MAG: hypothetical protein JWO46_2964 [Nocardioidaceae bacterium]|nr:hypothetical protein [Nocardioidaceae bacterium]
MTRRDLDDIMIRSQSDLHEMWEVLMQPLGFGRRSVWLTLIGPDGRPARFLLEIAESDGMPSARDVRNLYVMLQKVLEETGAGFSAALLITRPGFDLLSEDDRQLARVLVEGARTAGVPIQPIHVANDRSVLAMAPDDLAA